MGVGGWSLGIGKVLMVGDWKWVLGRFLEGGEGRGRKGAWRGGEWRVWGDAKWWRFNLRGRYGGCWCRGYVRRRGGLGGELGNEGMGGML